MWKKIADWLAELVFGVSVSQTLGLKKLIELRLEAKEKVVKKQGEIVDELRTKYNAEKYKKEAKERTIKSKDTMINGMRVMIKEAQKEINFWQGKAKENADFFQKSIELGKVKEKEYRRRIKCLHENVRARNIRIEKLESTEVLKNVHARVKKWAERAGALQIENQDLERKFRDAKTALANCMERNKK